MGNNSPNTDEGSNHHQIAVPEQGHETFHWNKAPGSFYEDDLNEAYEQMVYWRKNIFM